MAITAQDVNKLRQMTGMGMMDCKQALTEADGDFDKAIEILRKKGEKISAKRADNETKEGVVLIHNNNTEAVMLSLNCETESVSKNDEFNSIAKLALDTAIAHKCTTSEALLGTQANGRTLQEVILEFTGKVGEKIVIGDYSYITGEQVVSYLHSNSKMGVLVALKGANGADVLQAGKDVAMQIASMNPIAIDKEDVSAEVIEKEIEIGKEQARNEGKPEEMIEKIALGKLNKFYKEATLLNQEFVKDNSKSVRQMLQGISKDLTVSAFKRISVV